ncbi:hypothetical protein [Streptomyces sp. NPDC013489]|uniref:hypothetical protein n=1 Tax=Streptomyces sp. NPDC013489 TaxID=3155606 RepID=UPI0033C275D7
MFSRIFRRNRSTRPTTQTEHGTVYGALPPRPEPPRIEHIGITLAEMQTFERILRYAEACKRKARSDIPAGTYQDELIGRLYEGAGAASVIEPDPEKARVPVSKHDFSWLQYAIRDIEQYRGNPEVAKEGRQLLNRFHALLGQSRAVIHLGGTTAVFDPSAPAPAAPGTPELP